LGLGKCRFDPLMVAGTGALRTSIGFVAGPLSGRLWKNGWFQKKAMLVGIAYLQLALGPSLSKHSLQFTRTVLHRRSILPLHGICEFLKQVSEFVL
jgi:hypothetical protein